MRRLLRFLLRAAFTALFAAIAVVLALRALPPPTTAFMIEHRLQHPLRANDYRWVSDAHISANLRLAVIAAEDQRFPLHDGFDFVAIEKAAAHNRRGGSVRGASTISQQTAKNLFLWPGRSYLRKGVEAAFTLLLEQLWGKKRILEVYVNVAEMGDGVFGAEAAAQRFFHKAAADLTREEAATLAAVLPNPEALRADRPSAYVLKRRQWILGQMQALGGVAYLSHL